MPLLKVVSDIAERLEMLLSAIRAVKYKNSFFVIFCSKRPKSMVSLFTAGKAAFSPKLQILQSTEKRIFVNSNF